MRVLVTFAVEVEFAPWRKLRKFQSANRNAVREFTALLGDGKDHHEIRVLLTGIGREACCESVQSWEKSNAEQPDLVISSGFAGALKDGLLPGTVVAPARTHTLQEDADVECDSTLRQGAVRMGAEPIETMITLDRLVKTAEEKSKLAFYGEAVDMESAHVSSHFKKTGSPVTVLRVISDAATEDLPLDFDRCLTPQGAIRPMSLVNQIVRRPNNLPNLIRFGKQSYQAGQALARFLEGFVTELPAAVGRFARV